MERRTFMQGLGMLVTSGTAARETTMYGLIGKMTAAPGSRDALVAILLDGTQAMPGCLSYIVAHDPANADAIWDHGSLGWSGEPHGVAAAAGRPGRHNQGEA